MIKTVTIPGAPVAKGAAESHEDGRAYTPNETRQWERMAAQAIRFGWGLYSDD